MTKEPSEGKKAEGGFGRLAGLAERSASRDSATVGPGPYISVLVLNVSSLACSAGIIVSEKIIKLFFVVVKNKK